MNQQQPHPNGAGNNGAPLPPNQYAYINSMIGTQGGNPGNPLVGQHQMQQVNNLSLNSIFLNCLLLQIFF